MSFYHLAGRARITRAFLTVLLSAVAASSVFAQTSTATWDRNADAYTTGYRVSYGTQSGTYGTSIDVGNVVSYPLALAAGRTYYVVVAGYNAANQIGPRSAEVSITPASPPPPPTAAITATMGATGSAVVTWQTANATAVTVNGAAVALSGTAQYPITQTTTYQVVATGPGGSVAASATAVVAARVDCQLSAWVYSSATAWGACTSGQRTRNETWTRTVVTQPSGGGLACGALQEIRVASQPCTVAPTAQVTARASATPGMAIVNWQSTNATSATLNGAAVATSGSAEYALTVSTTYRLVVTGPGGTASASATVAPTAVDCVQSAWSLQSTTAWGACSGGQQTRTETWVRSVITAPLNGGAACGAPQELRTAAQACSSQTPVAPGTPTSFRASVSGTTVTFNWNVPATGGVPEGYRLWVGTTTNYEIVTGTRVGNVLTASGTVPAGLIYARVAAHNVAGVSTPTAPITVRVGANLVPNQPLGFTASLQASVLVMSWTAPAGEIQNAPTGYTVEAGSASGLTDIATVAVGNTLNYQVAVPPGTYFLRVKATNAIGVSQPSSELVVRQGDGLGAPVNLQESGTGSFVRLTWQVPTTGDVPAGYLLEVGSASGRADLAVLRLGNVTTWSTTSAPGVFYVRVRAVSANGTAGDASNELRVRR